MLKLERKQSIDPWIIFAAASLEGTRAAKCREESDYSRSLVLWGSKRTAEFAANDADEMMKQLELRVGGK